MFCGSPECTPDSTLKKNLIEKNLQMKVLAFAITLLKCLIKYEKNK